MPADYSIRVLNYAHTDLPFEFCGGVPIHSKPLESSRCPAIDATLIPSIGTKTRKPQAAERPIPRQRERANSISVIRRNGRILDRYLTAKRPIAAAPANLPPPGAGRSTRRRR